MVILVGGEKGGTGKSTIATNLAGYLALTGGDVLLLDTDSQATAMFWAMARDENEKLARVPCLHRSGGQIHREVETLKTKFKHIIIDAGGRDSIELRSSMVIADKLFIPIRPSQFDIWTIEKINMMVEEVQILNFGLKAFAFANLASTNPRVGETAEAQEYISEFDHISLSTSIVRDRIAFRNAGKNGLCVFELDDQKAKDEIKALCEEVLS